MALEYKENPPTGDFMSDVMSLLEDKDLFPGDDKE
eukprot:CAMPEP_0205802202 /NCGR_PEP_ID=MMETSP0205-20121125/4431_1 /ASSEMBLY_ACC=CAM_ASM_000278 /TAXON_ID=36767 /ORGANISM="Euplotes focardii, Strain TN1" /LENGTH=34 /DNA_ID= /DNA_START= /DNA_END= /DNA_ORIENTATION=